MFLELVRHFSLSKILIKFFPEMLIIGTVHSMVSFLFKYLLHCFVLGQKNFCKMILQNLKVYCPNIEIYVAMTRITGTWTWYLVDTILQIFSIYYSSK